MALCDVCGQEMTTAAPCSLATLIVADRRRNRIPFGKEKLWEMAPRATTADRCGDCGVGRGGFHHPGCATEECMVCGAQLFSCDCDKEEPKPRTLRGSPPARSRRAEGPPRKPRR